MKYWEKFQPQVIQPGNCMHCGACVGLNPELLKFQESERGPLPQLRQRLEPEEDKRLKLAWAVCSGRGTPFPDLFASMYGKQPENLMLGPTKRVFIGHSGNEEIRKNGASGGILTGIAINLLETEVIDGVVTLAMGVKRPDEATPIIATNRTEILASAQSVYAVTPMLTIFSEMEKFSGKLAFIGLPEQNSVLRMLQTLGHPTARKVKLILGPYTGTNMYFGAVRSFLRSKGVKDSTPIENLQYRAGEWPGKLSVTLNDGKCFEAEKFFYNYLIPFFISRHCQIIPDFSNELTDISVGDAWSPLYESQRGGYSVVITRSQQGDDLVEQMSKKGSLVLEEKKPKDVIVMHSHMFDFKKRGAFLRLEAQSKKGLPTPDYGYWPLNISFKRRLVELVVRLLFSIGKIKWVIWSVERLPVSFVGKCFSILRVSWKRVSKPTKYKGLTHLQFAKSNEHTRWEEIQTIAQSTSYLRTEEENCL